MATVLALYVDPTTGWSREALTTDSISIGSVVAAGVGGVAFDAGGNRAINGGTPTLSTDFATKGYVDAFAQGVNIKPNVAALATTNITLSGTQTIDGVALSVGQRALLTAQTSGIQNGIWVVQSGAWTRPTAPDDYVTGSHANGAFLLVEGGTVWANSQWACYTASGSDVVDTNATAWTQMNGLGDITVTAPIVKVGANGIALTTGNGLTTTAGALVVALTSGGGLVFSSGTLGILLRDTTLSLTGLGLGVLGVPSLWTVNGVATSANVTASNLNTLTAGTASVADTLHTHTNVASAKALEEFNLTNGAVALSNGDPVQWSSTNNTLQRCDATSPSTSQTWGICIGGAAANATTTTVLRQGTAAAVLSSATAGAYYWLAVGGGITASRPLTGGVQPVRIGQAKNATDLEVDIQFQSII